MAGPANGVADQPHVMLDAEGEGAQAEVSYMEESGGEEEEWEGEAKGEEEANGSSSSGSDDGEEDARQFGIYQALPVGEGEPDFDSGEPETAEEYLRRVRWEAAQLPDVVTSEVDPRQFDARRSGTAYGAAAAGAGMPRCPQALSPSPAWQRDFLSRFAQLRRELQREYEHGSAGGQQQQQPSSLTPELLQLRGLDQVELVQRTGAHMRRVMGGQGLSPADAAWLYAYSARVEKPLHADTCALYRALLRHCAQLRAQLTDPQDPQLAHLNILIAIAGACFGQDEELAAVWEET